MVIIYPMLLKEECFQLVDVKIMLSDNTILLLYLSNLCDGAQAYYVGCLTKKVGLFDNRNRSVNTRKDVMEPPFDSACLCTAEFFSLIAPNLFDSFSSKNTL
ncbi:MAG: hypothetical protein EOP04_03815 [Proteobacteria bacterium]|nr:MAG: hypothetical protein EOP04_03815 [Pseudomonadota bacterium]